MSELASAMTAHRKRIPREPKDSCPRPIAEWLPRRTVPSGNVVCERLAGDGKGPPATSRSDCGPAPSGPRHTSRTRCDLFPEAAGWQPVTRLPRRRSAKTESATQITAIAAKGGTHDYGLASSCGLLVLTTVHPTSPRRLNINRRAVVSALSHFPGSVPAKKRALRVAAFALALACASRSELTTWAVPTLWECGRHSTD